MYRKYNFDVAKATSDLADFKTKQRLWNNDVIWKASENCTALVWWKAFCKDRELSKVVVKILAIPATSASCEKNWSTFSSIKTKKRNRLNIDRTHKLVAVKFILNLFIENDLKRKLVELSVANVTENDKLNLEKSAESDNLIDDNDNSDSEEDTSFSSQSNEEETECILDDKSCGDKEDSEGDGALMDVEQEDPTTDNCNENAATVPKIVWNNPGKIYLLKK